ncbi:MAG: hypothetical protein QM811_00925 [Pirellulales bacterium]
MIHRFQTIQELRAAGLFDWTIFSFPTALADAEGMPPNETLKDLVRELRSRGFTIDIWCVAMLGPIIYWGCDVAVRAEVLVAIDEFQRERGLSDRFLTEECEKLFAISIVKPNHA